MKTRKQLFPWKAIVFWATIALSLSGGTEIFAQRIKYTYDNSGNRKTRQKETTAKKVSADINISPNPTRGMLKVDILDTQQFEKALIALYDTTGTLLQQWKDIIHSNELDISAYSAGEYMLQITLNDEARSWRIIKE